MARGYWIVRVDVHDPDSYKDYAAANGAAFREFGGRFLVRGGPFECVSGSARERNVVIEFASYEDALACWQSKLYQDARAKQRGATSDVVIIGGYDGPQPNDAQAAPPASTASS